MKKIYLAFLLIFSVQFLFGQSPRVLLLEHFTQASCPPCASYNPIVQELIENNPGEIVSVKYQTSWPGYDPMNEHNPAQAQTRVNYYGVSGVPHSVIDGNHFSNNPYYLDQEVLDDRLQYPSPFELKLSHTISANLDSIYARLIIKATQNFGYPLVAHIIVVEREINFDEAPGSNGEKSFHNVMKRMLPTDSGTDLPTSFTTGDSTIIDVAWKLENVFNKNELAVIGFVQDDGNKQIQQAVMSDKIQLYAENDYDLAITNVSNMPISVCGNEATIAPIITVANMGSISATTIDFSYSVNNEEIVFTYNNSIPYTVEKTIQFPDFTFNIADENNLIVYPVSINGNFDQNLTNDTVYAKIQNASLVHKKIILEILFDSKPHETFWKLYSSEQPSEILFNGGPYSSSVANTVVRDTFEFSAAGCYEFLIQDARSNGLEDSAYYKLMDINENIIYEGQKFTNKEIVPFEVDLESSLTAVEFNTNNFSVFPNPSSETTNISFFITDCSSVKISIFSAVGQLIYQTPNKEYLSGKHTIDIPVSNWNNGVYIVQIAVNKQIFSKKLLINN